MKKIFGLVAVMVLACNIVYADKWSVGQIVIDDNSRMYGEKDYPEAVTTNDTLTAADSGKILYSTYNSGTDLTWTLPTAVSGLDYTLTTVRAKEFRVDPAVADRIYYSTCATGDRIDSAGATGDSVRLVGISGGWLVKSMVGTFTDGE